MAYRLWDNSKSHGEKLRDDISWVPCLYLLTGYAVNVIIATMMTLRATMGVDFISKPCEGISKTRNRGSDNYDSLIVVREACHIRSGWVLIAPST